MERDGGLRGAGDGGSDRMSDLAQPQSRTRVRGGLGSARYLVTHRKLLTRVVTNDLRQRYAGSVLGLGWAFAAPLLVLAIYSVIYLEIFRVKVPNLSSF